MDMEIPYQVCWRISLTGFEGCGSSMRLESAEAWMRYANAMFPYIEHWIEVVGTL